MKNARRRGEQRQRPACKGRQNPRRQSRNCQGGGETGRKMHAGEVKKGRGSACKGRQNPRRHRREDQGGGEMGRKMHAGEVKKGSGQRANEDKFSAARVETIKAAEKWKEKCTPVRRAKAETGVQTKTKSPPAESKRPRRRRNRKKNARRRGEKRQRPTCKRRQNLRRQSRNCQGGGEMGRKMHAGEVSNGSGQRANEDKFPAASVQREAKSPPE